MSKKSQAELMDKALSALRSLGFSYTYGREKGDELGKSVEFFQHPDSVDSPLRILVQCRSAQSVRDNLYWVGFMQKELPNIHRVVVWIENQPVLFMFPVEKLREWLSECRQDRQLKVNIDPVRRLLWPQNSNERHDINDYAMTIPIKNSD